MRQAKMLILAGLALANPAIRAEEVWGNLFNGQDLTGWVQRGGQARYAVENDIIVGTSVLNTPNSFLCTEKAYGDFILEYDFKVDPRLNSGVQIRSECFETPKQIDWKGKRIEIPAGRVHGYQVEIDPDVPRKRLWSAGLYDESRRGWLFPSDGQTGPQGKAFSEQGLRIFKPQDWNHIRVEAIGDSIRTWLNGTPCADLKDGLTPRGFIALQVHGIRDDTERAGSQVRWRNLRIKEMTTATPTATPLNTLTESEKAAGWRLLWDGKTTDGWRGVKTETFPTPNWDIADSTFTVHGIEGFKSAGRGNIITRERFASFELVADFKITPGANSGIKYFVQPNLDPANHTGAGPAVGCEFQILDDERHPDAKLGRNGNRTLGALYDLIPPATSKKPNPVGEWNTARILVQGQHVEHWLNGQKVVEYERGTPEFRAIVAQSKYKNIPDFGEWPDGHILLQEHGNEVSFRNIKIRAAIAGASTSDGHLQVRRFDQNPIIGPEMLPVSDAGNINGPSLIRVPDWITNRLGNYYLYFAHHSGKYIRLAYADQLPGPWKIYEPGTLRLEAAPGCKGHIASPDVQVDEQQRQIRMYFHGPAKAAPGQKSFAAVSADGLRFRVTDEILGIFYWRVFRWDGWWYAMGKGGLLYRSRDGLTDFEQGPNPFPGSELRDQEFNRPGPRHVAVHRVEDTLWIYYSSIGDEPERILRCRIKLTSDWKNWKTLGAEEVLRPETAYEGVDLPQKASVAGAMKEREHALRDPGIFVDNDGRVYLLYSVAGESGIAIAELQQ